MTPAELIPLTLLTGFLGSGKTTMLNDALAAPEMARTAVVINEYGDVAIDHDLTIASDDYITVLENGCLCCTVFGDLVGALQRLYHDREAGRAPAFERVIIETSGLADPVPVMQAFLSDPVLAKLYRVETAVVVIDAINGLDTLARHSEAQRQVAVADQLIITKLDIPGARDGLDALMAALRRINPSATLLHRDDPAVRPAVILVRGSAGPAGGALEWLDADAYAKAPPEHHHDHGPPIAAHCLIRDTPVRRDALHLLLAAIEHNLGPNLLRVKGLVHIAEEAERPAIIQGAQHLLHNLTFRDGWPSDDRRTRIVFITQNIDPAALEEMVTMLDRISTRTANARAGARA